MFIVKSYLYKFHVIFADGKTNTIWSAMSADRAKDIEDRMNNRCDEVKLEVTKVSEVNSFDADGYLDYSDVCQLFELTC